MESLHRLTRMATSLFALCLSACTESTDPWSSVGLRTEVAEATASAGDIVLIRAILTNPTTRQISINSQCGPPVLFELRTGSGSSIYPVPLDASFTCELTDVHILEPGETDTVAVRWRVAAATGVYEVRSGFVRTGGLQRLSAPVALVIR